MRDTFLARDAGYPCWRLRNRPCATAIPDSKNLFPPILRFIVHGTLRFQCRFAIESGDTAHFQMGIAAARNEERVNG